MSKIDYNILHIIDNQLILTLSWHYIIKIILSAVLIVLREEEENNLPQMKHIRKRTIQTGRLFFSSSLS